MKNILICALLLLLSISLLSAQSSEKHFFPTKVIQVDLSKKTEKEIERQSYLLKQKKLNSEENKELDKLLENYGETVESVWDIIDGGCSWYCGGGNYKIIASSTLVPEHKSSYEAINANDLSYKTAWIEGKDGDGVGEFLEYYFKYDSPRISKIIISNGYMKSETAWLTNNRVKKLKLYINGVEFGILNLEDSRTDQTFELGTFGHNKDKSDLILKFEILEVYRGEKYNDTAITEIYFDGIDVH